MDPVYRNRLERILRATEKRQMMMIVGCLYRSTSKAKEDLSDWTQRDADQAIANTARCLGENEEVQNADGAEEDRRLGL